MQDRLQAIFGQDDPARSTLVSLAAARVVFVSLYVGAVEGSGRWMAPRHVYSFSDHQAALRSLHERERFAAALEKRSSRNDVQWYAQTTREPIRDDVLRNGLVPRNAILVRSGVPTTSPSPRYALRSDFAALFDPQVSGAELDRRIGAWRVFRLSPASLARAAILESMGVQAEGGVEIALPGSGKILLPGGASPVLLKQVVEVFVPHFLGNPRIAWLSDSARQRPFRDDPLTKAVGIPFEESRLLPDVVAVDLDPPDRPGRIRIVCIEAVVSDGAFTENRKEEIQKLISSSRYGYGPADVSYVSAFQDRCASSFRRLAPSIAWDTGVWFASDPSRILDYGGRLPLKVPVQ